MVRPAPVSPVIGKLIEDHQLVAAILRQVRELLGPDRPPSPPAALLRELDGLTAILESHFSFEERRIAQALNTLDPGSVDLRYQRSMPAPGTVRARQPPSPRTGRDHSRQVIALPRIWRKSHGQNGQNDPENAGLAPGVPRSVRIVRQTPAGGASFPLSR